MGVILSLGQLKRLTPELENHNRNFCTNTLRRLGYDRFSLYHALYMVGLIVVKSPRVTDGEHAGEPPTSLPPPPTPREDLRVDGYLKYPHAAMALYIYKHPCLLRYSNPVPTAQQSASLTTIPDVRHVTHSEQKSLLLYTAVLRPILTYGSPVWGYAADSNIKILEVAQNSLIRNIAF
ncbi:uncharacterized protein TNCV_4635201 [Trichonephila clavipes]|nr:uncharacterized protein TNCV_4635201 [Trichonephila clavipes]